MSGEEKSCRESFSPDAVALAHRLEKADSFTEGVSYIHDALALEYGRGREEVVNEVKKIVGCGAMTGIDDADCGQEYWDEAADAHGVAHCSVCEDLLDFVIRPNTPS